MPVQLILQPFSSTPNLIFNINKKRGEFWIEEKSGLKFQFSIPQKFPNKELLHIHSVLCLIVDNQFRHFLKNHHSFGIFSGMENETLCRKIFRNNTRIHDF